MSVVSEQYSLGDRPRVRWYLPDDSVQFTDTEVPAEDLSDSAFVLVTALHRLAEERPYGEGGEGLFVYARRA